VRPDPRGYKPQLATIEDLSCEPHAEVTVLRVPPAPPVSESSLSRRPGTVLAVQDFSSLFYHSASKHLVRRARRGPAVVQVEVALRLCQCGAGLGPPFGRSRVWRIFAACLLNLACAHADGDVFKYAWRRIAARLANP